MHSLATRVIDESRGAERKRKEENKRTNAVKNKSEEGKWQTDRKRKCLTPPQLCLGKTGESQTRCSQLPAGQDSLGRAEEQGENSWSVSLDQAQSSSSSSSARALPVRHAMSTRLSSEPGYWFWWFWLPSPSLQRWSPLPRAPLRSGTLWLDVRSLVCQPQTAFPGLVKAR